MHIRTANNKTKYIVWAVLTAFLAQDLAWAAPDPGMFRPAATVTRSIVAPSLPDILKDPRLIRTPFESCRIKEIHTGTNGKLLIHIQDAHANYSGQMNLAKTLESLSRAYGINLILGEGSEGDMTLDKLKTVADDKTWKIAAKRFLQDGVIVGEEYLNLTSNLPIKIIGVEDQQLYDESLFVYEKLTQNRPKVLEHLRRIRISLDRIKNRHYPKELLAYEAKKKDSLEDLSKRLDLLEPLARTQPIDWKNYPQTTHLLELKKREKEISFERLRGEEEQLFAKLSARGKRGDLDKILEALKKSNGFSQTHLWEELFRLAEDGGENLADYPELKSYREYLKSFDGINLERTLEETDLIEDEVYRLFLPEENQRRLKAIERFLELLEKAYRVQMSSQEFEALLLNQKDFPAISWQAFLNDELSKLKYFDDLVPYKEILEASLKPIFEFYQLVERRDRAFLRNSVRAMNMGNDSAAFLITGGYHTQHLTDLIRQQNYSYVVLTPMVDQATDPTKYEKILLGPLAFLKRQNTPPAKTTEPTPTSIDTLRPEYLAGKGGQIAAARLAGTTGPFGLNLPEVLAALRGSSPKWVAPTSQNAKIREGVTAGARMAEGDRGKWAAAIEGVVLEVLPRAPDGWEGENRRLVARRIAASAIYGFNPAVGYEERLSYAVRIARRTFRDTPDKRRSYITETFKVFIPLLLNMFLMPDNMLNILIRIEQPLLADLYRLSISTDPSDARIREDTLGDLTEFNHGMREIAEAKAANIAAHIKDQVVNTRAIFGSHIRFSDFVKFISKQGFKMSMTMDDEHYLPVIFARDEDPLGLDLVMDHELAHNRGVVAGNSAFSLLSQEDDPTPSVDPAAIYRRFRTLQPTSKQYEEMKQNAGHWVQLRFSSFMSDRPMSRAEHMGTLVKEEDWTYFESWQVAAIASGFAQAHNLPRQAAYDILRLNLTATISPQDQAYYALATDTPLPLHEACIKVLHAYKPQLAHPTATRMAALSPQEAYLHALLAEKIGDLQERGPADAAVLASLFAADRRLLAPYEKWIKTELERHQALRVLQFNQMGSPTTERLDQMRAQFRAVASNVPVSIITLQETTQSTGKFNTAVEVAYALGLKYVEQEHGQEFFDDGFAILYHPSFEKLKHYHEIIQVAGVQKQAVLLGVTLKSTITGQIFHIFTTRLHWATDAMKQRMEQISLMNARISQLVGSDEPIIFAGDFNYYDEVEAGANASVLAGFDDTFKTVNPDLEGVTTAQFYRPIKFNPGKRPDLIYARGMTPLDSRIVLNEVQTSDHFGVWSDMGFLAQKSKAIPDRWVDPETIAQILTALDAVSDPTASAEYRQQIQAMSGARMASPQINIDPATSREAKIEHVFSLLDAVQFQTFRAKDQRAILKLADQLTYSDGEFDEYEELLLQNLKISDSAPIKALLKKYAREYMKALADVPKTTLVVIQAAGQSTRLNQLGGPKKDKNTVKSGGLPESEKGLSQIQRQLNVLAALGYRHVLVVHNDWNQGPIKADIKTGHYPASMKVEWMDGSRREWLDNLAEAVRSASGRYKKVMMLIGESPVSLDYLARLRFSNQEDVILFYPAPSSMHKPVLTPGGPMKSYRNEPGQGDSALVSFTAPTQDLMDHLFESSNGPRLEGRNLETWIANVHAAPTTAAYSMSEAADNINTLKDLDLLRKQRFHNIDFFGHMSGGQTIFPRRMAKAVLILSGHYLSALDLDVQSLGFSHHSTVWRAGNKFVKAQLDTSVTSEDRFTRKHFLRELWFHMTKLGILKPGLIFAHVGSGTIITQNVAGADGRNFSHWITDHDASSASTPNPSGRDILLKHAGGMMRLLSNLQRSDQKLDTYSVENDTKITTLWSKQLAALGFDASGWAEGLGMFERYYSEYPPDLVLSHGDYGPHNIVIANHKMYLIDGEYAGTAAPREKDLATAIVRTMQISRHTENLSGLIRTMLTAYRKYSKHTIDLTMLYYFMSRAFLEAAYDTVYFGSDDLAGRSYLELRRQFLALMAENIKKAPTDQKAEDVTQKMMDAYLDAKAFTNILDHLRRGRIKDDGDFHDPNLMPNTAAYFFTSPNPGKILSMLYRLSTDREPGVSKNAQLAIQEIQRGIEASSLEHDAGARLAKHNGQPALAARMAQELKKGRLTDKEGVYQHALAEALRESDDMEKTSAGAEFAMVLADNRIRLTGEGREQWLKAGLIQEDELSQASDDLGGSSSARMQTVAHKEAGILLRIYQNQRSLMDPRIPSSRWDRSNMTKIRPITRLVRFKAAYEFLLDQVGVGSEEEYWSLQDKLLAGAESMSQTSGYLEAAKIIAKAYEGAMGNLGPYPTNIKKQYLIAVYALARSGMPGAKAVQVILRHFKKAGIEWNTLSNDPNLQKEYLIAVYESARSGKAGAKAVQAILRHFMKAGIEWKALSNEPILKKEFLIAVYESARSGKAGAKAVQAILRHFKKAGIEWKTLPNDPNLKKEFLIAVYAPALSGEESARAVQTIVRIFKKSGIQWEDLSNDLKKQYLITVYEPAMFGKSGAGSVHEITDIFMNANFAFGALRSDKQKKSWLRLVWHFAVLKEKNKLTLESIQEIVGKIVDPEDLHRLKREIDKKYGSVLIYRISSNGRSVKGSLGARMASNAPRLSGLKIAGWLAMIGFFCGPMSSKVAEDADGVRESDNESELLRASVEVVPDPGIREQIEKLYDEALEIIQSEMSRLAQQGIQTKELVKPNLRFFSKYSNTAVAKWQRKSNTIIVNLGLYENLHVRELEKMRVRAGLTIFLHELMHVVEVGFEESEFIHEGFTQFKALELTGGLMEENNRHFAYKDEVEVIDRIINWPGADKARVKEALEKAYFMGDHADINAIMGVEIWKAILTLSRTLNVREPNTDAYKAGLKKLHILLDQAERSGQLRNKKPPSPFEMKKSGARMAQDIRRGGLTPKEDVYRYALAAGLRDLSILLDKPIGEELALALAGNRVRLTEEGRKAWLELGLIQDEQLSGLPNTLGGYDPDRMRSIAHDEAGILLNAYEKQKSLMDSRIPSSQWDKSSIIKVNPITRLIRFQAAYEMLLDQVGRDKDYWKLQKNLLAAAEDLSRSWRYLVGAVLASQVYLNEIGDLALYPVSIKKQYLTAVYGSAKSGQTGADVTQAIINHFKSAGIEWKNLSPDLQKQYLIAVYFAVKSGQSGADAIQAIIGHYKDVGIEWKNLSQDLQKQYLIAVYQPTTRIDQGSADATQAIIGHYKDVGIEWKNLSTDLQKQYLIAVYAPAIFGQPGADAVRAILSHLKDAGIEWKNLSPDLQKQYLIAVYYPAMSCKDGSDAVQVIISHLTNAGIEWRNLSDDPKKQYLIAVYTPAKLVQTDALQNIIDIFKQNNLPFGILQSDPQKESWLILLWVFAILQVNNKITLDEIRSIIHRHPDPEQLFQLKREILIKYGGFLMNRLFRGISSRKKIAGARMAMSQVYPKILSRLRLGQFSSGQVMELPGIGAAGARFAVPMAESIMPADSVAQIAVANDRRQTAEAMEGMGVVAVRSFLDFAEQFLKDQKYLLVVDDGLLKENADLIRTLVSALQKFNIEVVLMPRSQVEPSKTAPSLRFHKLISLVSAGGARLALPGAAVLAVSEEGRSEGRAFHVVLAVMALMGLAATDTGGEFVERFGLIMNILGLHLSASVAEMLKAYVPDDLEYERVLTLNTIRRVLPSLAQALAAARMAVSAVLSSA